MTSSHWLQDEINSEQAVNEEYLRKANRRRRNFLNRRRDVSTPRNALWAASPPKIPGPALGPIKPLIGRVALDYDDSDLGASFYVGSWHTELDHTVVISWVANSARLLFADGPRPGTIPIRAACSRAERFNTTVTSSLTSTMTSNRKPIRRPCSPIDPELSTFPRRPGAVARAANR